MRPKLLRFYKNITKYNNNNNNNNNNNHHALMVTLNPGVGANVGALMLAIPSPRIGRGNDSTAWTGGPNVNLTRLSRPNSTMARYPTNFILANSIKQIAMKGLPENRHIGPDEKTSKITLTSWVNSTCSYIEEQGLDTIFYVYDISAGTEIYLLTNWGSASPATESVTCLSTS
jgi:hypothetical protein